MKLLTLFTISSISEFQENRRIIGSLCKRLNCDSDKLEWKVLILKLKVEDLKSAMTDIENILKDLPL